MGQVRRRGLAGFHSWCVGVSAGPRACWPAPGLVSAGAFWLAVLIGSAAAAAVDCSSPPEAGLLASSGGLSINGQFGIRGVDAVDSEKESEDISGLACAPQRDGGDRLCILASDGVRYARIVELKGETLKLGGTRELVPRRIDRRKVKQADVEGVAFTDEAGPAYFYVTGSHGASRHGAPKYEPARYRVFRLLYDPRWGAIGGAEYSTRLEDIILTFGALAEKACRRDGPCTSLKAKGTNIEGLAAKGADLYFGFRAPTPDGKAYVLKVPADSLFGAGSSPGELLGVDIGKKCGIRDLVAVDGGFLILAGLDASEKKTRSYTSHILFWDGQAEHTKLLGSLPSSGKKGKPEALLVLGTDAAQGHYRLLVLRDGVAGGKPTRYVVPLP